MERAREGDKAEEQRTVSPALKLEAHLRIGGPLAHGEPVYLRGAEHGEEVLRMVRLVRMRRER